MDSAPGQNLRRTALHPVHKRLGAKMVDFGGWDMPVEYGGLIREHMAVRTGVGLFDVSHMGEIDIQGPPALELVQKIACNDASKLDVGQAHYSCLMYEHGTLADDMLVYRVAEDHFFLVVNAGNQDTDYAWMLETNQSIGATLVNNSANYSLLAVQGPRTAEVLKPICSVDLSPVKYYWFTHGEVAGVRCRIARTGYTGEDCFELFFAPEHSEQMWDALMEAGASAGILPCGLGARNTLRLEAGMSLYGHEIDATHTPLEAGLDRYVKLDKGEFIGREALAKQKVDGLRRKLVGLEMTGRGIARDGYPVYLSESGDAAGIVTSGSPAPFLKKNIALAYLPANSAEVGRPVWVGVRGQRVAAQIVPTPFYKRKKS
jgi:aminomethyltransferase